MKIETREALAFELKRLVGYGARPQHVISKPVLVSLVEAKYPNLETRALGQAIIEELTAASAQLDEAEAVRELLVLSRRYGHVSAVVRRENVIRLLKAHCSVEAWRRPDGAELDLMRDLATALIERLGAKAAA